MDTTTPAGRAFMQIQAAFAEMERNVMRQGEIRDRSTEGQHYRMAGLNLLAAIVIYWNTARLGEAVAKRRHAGVPVAPELLPHISPLGWTHILLTGEYRWQKRR